MAAGVPRNFKLLDELDEAEKSSKGGADISLGLSRPDDTYMTDWQASIFAQADHHSIYINIDTIRCAPLQGMGEPRIWFLTITADKDYPTKAPTLKFTSKIIMDCVDARGNVIASKVPYLATWNSSKSMLAALTEIKALIQRAPRSQPPEGSSF